MKWAILYRCRWCQNTFFRWTADTDQAEMAHLLVDNRPVTHVCSPEGDDLRIGLGDPIGIRPAKDYES